jgi:CheY-like chemotaxis protein
MNGRAVTVLLVDDDKVDVAAVRRSFAALQIGNPIVEANNGIEALEHLRGDNNRPKLPSPNIVLLDLNMPCMNGVEFLEELRADAELNATVVFVLTTSNAPDDRRDCYERHISGYLLKHQPGRDFPQTVAMLEQYWRTNVFPG